MGHWDTHLRAQPRLDIKWLKTNIENIYFTNENLVNTWNTLITDGEITGNFSTGLLNSAGVMAKEGEFGKYYCGQRVCIKINSLTAVSMSGVWGSV